MRWRSAASRGRMAGRLKSRWGRPGLLVADDKAILARKFVFPGDREFIRDRGAKMALTMLRFRILGKQLPF